jgi:hypothetical protein
VESQHIFFHFVGKLYNVFPVLFNGLDEIPVLLPVFFRLDLIDGKEQLVDFVLKRFNLVQKQAHIVRELFFLIPFINQNITIRGQ